MPSDQHTAAQNEMRLLVDTAQQAAASADLSIAERALAAASAEARMLFWSQATVTMGLRPNSPESITEQVSHLMNSGRSTLDELILDIKSMSAEGREHAMYLLAHHPSAGVRQIGSILDPVVDRDGPPPGTMPAREAAENRDVELVQQLQRLGDLRTAGVLTQQEFEAAKARLLA